MTSAWKRYKEKLGDTRPWDVLNPNIEKASDEVAESRLSICIDCDRFIALTKQCKECGCFMPAKTTIQAAICPLNKW